MAENDKGFIDLPFESGSSDPQPLRYAKLGKCREGEDFRDAQKRVREAEFGEFAPPRDNDDEGDTDGE